MLSVPLYPLGINEFNNSEYKDESENLSPKNHILNLDCSENIIIKKTKRQPKNTNTVINIPTYSDYIANPNILKIYKIPELKCIAKNYKLYVTGNKSSLIERILKYFNSISKTVNIQKVFRGYLVRTSFKLRGEGFKKRSLCNNISDFYSLEPLDEIDFRLFFSYKDNNGFIYGFNIESIFVHISKIQKSSILNPYNREKFSQEIIDKIYSLKDKICIIFPGVFDTSILTNLHNSRNNSIFNNNSIRIANNIRNNQNNQTTQNNQNNYPVELPRTRRNINGIEIGTSRTILERITTPDILRLNNNRETNFETRLRELFMEIDTLGNYTQIRWFSSLTHFQYIRMYRLLYNIWARLSLELRNRICILRDPFLNIFESRLNSEDISFERIQEACLRVFENMVFTGIDTEYRKIGALHVLSALTTVSLEARLAMPWLYESVAF
jgi:hypothetical protein